MQPGGGGRRRTPGPGSRPSGHRRNHTRTPYTYGDTFVHLSEFDLLVEARDPPIYFSCRPVDAVFDRIAANVAALVEDGNCLAFSIGPIYEP